MSSRGPLIIIGASARAAAQSAIRAGYEPWCIDLFADRDLQAIAPVKRCPRERWPGGIIELMENAPQGPVLFTGAMENHPELITIISEQRTLLGSSVHCIAKSRDPDTLASLFWGVGDDACIGYPRSYVRVSSWRRMLMRFGRDRWLVKPQQGSNGAGIRSWSPTQPVPTGHLIQREIPGESMSALFAADGDQLRLLMLTRQIVGDVAFGAVPYQHVGNIGPIRDDTLYSTMTQAVGRLHASCSFNGLFGVDFIHESYRRDWITEVNPRYTSSVELFELATGLPALVKENASVRGTLRSHSDGWRGCQGKAIVYAKHSVKWRDWLLKEEMSRIADVPSEEQVIDRGHPICTVFAQGSTQDECYDGLREMAEKVYTRLQPA